MSRLQAELLSTLAQARTARGVTQEQLARAAGVSRQTINAMERGDYNPSTVLALRLATLLSVPVDQLFSLPNSAVVDLERRFVGICAGSEGNGGNE
jgi:putative transcriptional regulator